MRKNSLRELGGQQVGRDVGHSKTPGGGAGEGDGARAESDAPYGRRAEGRRVEWAAWMKEEEVAKREPEELVSWC